jgi:hypothetical protein
LAESAAFVGVGGEEEDAGLPEAAAFVGAGGEEEDAGLPEAVAHFCARGGREAAGMAGSAAFFCTGGEVAPAAGFLAPAACGAGARPDGPLALGGFGPVGKVGPAGKGGAEGEGAAGTSTPPVSDGGSRPAAAAALAVINHRCNSMLVMAPLAWPGPLRAALPVRV